MKDNKFQKSKICGKEKCEEYENALIELKKVKKLTKKLDTVLESSYDGIYITDGEGITLRVNKAYERITGLKAEEFVGKHVEYLVKKGIISKSCSSLVLEKKEIVTIEQRLSNGKIVLVTGTPIFDDDSNIEMVVINVRDITDLIALKVKLEEKDRQVYEFNSQIEKLKSRLFKDENEKIRSQNKSMKTVLEMAKRVASHDTTVLVTGETGVGKEVITELIHKNSPRKDQKLIKVNCSAIPGSLIESELFGYEKGSFTGANKDGKIGIFEEASGGTLFLDEIGELPFNVQAKLLRVLQENEITRIGSSDSIKIDVRIIAATNRDLQKQVREGNFRSDLYYRLNIIPIHIPPLRERKEDIIKLSKEFLDELSLKYGEKKSISNSCYEILTGYEWPGNIRELKNLIERLYVMVEGDKINSYDIPDYIKDVDIEFKTTKTSLKEAVLELEIKMIDEAYERYKNVRDASKSLGIDASTFVRKRQKYERKMIKKSQI